MRTVKSEMQSVLTKTYLIAGRPRLCISMISAFSLASPDRLLDESEPWGAAADGVDDVAPFDQFMPKAHGEYLVGGSAYAPKGRESSGFEISVRVGSLTKNITVLGDRHWGASGLANASTGKPRKFTRMPLTYARAFGGPDYPDNPAGTGYAPVSSQAEGLRLPNFQYPDRPVASPTETAPPASLGPLSLLARGRTRYLGTYGSKWQTDHWPGWPADFKSEYFNAAAPDQWLDDFFQGDEPLLLQNLHPEYERIESSLPGYRTRCFMTKNQKSGHITEEARVRLDTLWLFPDVMTGALFWRADVPVTDEEASDVVEIMAVPEPMSAPLRTAEEYRTMPAGSDEETPKTEPPAHDSGDEPAAPETELKPPPPDLDAQAGLIAEMEAAARETEQSYVDSLAAVGLDVNQIPPAKGLSLEQVKPSVQPLVFDPDMVQRELQEAESALDRMVQSLDIEQVQPPPPSEAFNRIMQQSSDETAEFLAQVASEEMDPEAYLALARETRLESEKIERLLADEENREKDIPPARSRGGGAI